MYYLYILFIIVPITTSAKVKRETPEFSVPSIINELPKLVKDLPPDLRGRRKGEAGLICLIGGTVQHSGPPYFAGISALKVGADNTDVVTSNVTSNVVKGYSPDLIVHPYFNTDTIAKVTPIIKKSDVVIIGPGLGTDEEILTLTYDVINTCKTLEKPLVIDADGLIALSKNPTILKDYPGPVILTPNRCEAGKLIKGMALTNDSDVNWYDYWGRNVSVLLKGDTDEFFSGNIAFNWLSSDGGSLRRCPGQGDMLAGALGTFLNWALKNEALISNRDNYPYFSQSVASYAAAKFIRYTNSRAFEQYGRSLVASDMIANIHFAFKDVFET